MSGGAHSPDVDPVEPLGRGRNDPYGAVPVTTGISPMVLWFIALSLVIIVMQGSFVVASSGVNHTWPAADAVKAALPPLHS